MKITNYKFQITKGERGQSLFELVVAIAISALIIVALVSLATVSIRNSVYSKNKALAANYAQEATEWLRGQRDNSIDIFFVKASENTLQSGTGYCLSGSPIMFGTLVAGISTTGNCAKLTENTIFTRYAILNTTTTPSGKTVVEADVTVTWSDSEGVHMVTSATNFTDWRQR